MGEIDEELQRELTTRERAAQHLKGWTKEALIYQLLNVSHRGWLEEWAEQCAE